eukprot:m.79563 g.79563  ORF g.79563 m.79563 type:complete len:301 (-) comp13283_c0_seq3:98-1000(-)
MDETPRKNPFLEDDFLLSPARKEEEIQERRSTYEDKLRGFIRASGSSSSSTHQEAYQHREAGRPKSASTTADGPDSSPTSSPSQGTAEASRKGLVCEGYLSKHRGMMQRRRRWFVLTENELRYHTDSAGPVLARVSRRNILTVHDILGTLRFQIDTDCCFGSKGQMHEMVLAAPSASVKARWLVALGLPPTDLSLAHILPVGLLIEGPATISAGEIWLRLLCNQLEVLVEEGGAVNIAIPYTRLVQVTVFKARSEILISAASALFANSHEMLLRFESAAERDKWASAMAQALPEEKIHEA